MQEPISVTTFTELKTSLKAAVTALVGDGSASQPSRDVPPGATRILRPYGDVVLEVSVAQGKVKGLPGEPVFLKLHAVQPRHWWVSANAQRNALLDIASNCQTRYYAELKRYEQWQQTQKTRTGNELERI